jgi:hypothetical protein
MVSFLIRMLAQALNQALSQCMEDLAFCPAIRTGICPLESSGVIDCPGDEHIEGEKA